MTWLTTANETVSARALVHGAHLVAGGGGDVARALYLHGRLPFSPRWAARFPQARLVEDWLMAGAHARDAWQEVAPAPDNDRWRIYRARDAAGGTLPCKLYLNLHPTVLGDGFARFLDVATRHRAPVFKVARDAPNLLRPDKLVIYLADPTAARALGAALATTFCDWPVQPLPFTGALDAAGVVSCGVDPPAGVGATLGASSWRGWITGMLAAAMTRGPADATPAARVAEALRHAAAIGIDTRRWVPGVLAA